MAELDATLSALGLASEPISLRMAGCPSGCARCYLAEIAFVGRTVDPSTLQGKFAIFVGGDRLGRRINLLYLDLVPLDQLVRSLSPLLVYFRQDRQPGESFGAFCNRLGVQRLHEIADASATPRGATCNPPLGLNDAPQHVSHGEAGQTP